MTLRRIGLLGAALLLTACTQTSGPNASSTPNPPGTPQAQPAASPAAAGPAASPGAAAPASSPVAAPSEVVDTQAGDLSVTDIPEGRGPRNIVQAINHTDNRFEARGHVDFSRIMGQTVQPVNEANAQSTCTDCQSIAVAVQVTVYRRGASNVAPQNVALAVNDHCSHCVTVARAIQYVIPVDDPREVPGRARELANRMNQEMRYFESVHDINQLDPKKAEARLQTIENQFNDLLQYANEQRDEKDDDTSPTPSPSATAATLVPTASTTPTLSSQPAISPAASPTAP